MNNVITILIDSVFSECLGKGRSAVSATPFIDKMIEEGIFAPNVYSYGPYTDAATKGLYSGQPSLRDYGYYYGLNSTEYYHFRTFKENGYETYAFYYPYYLIGSKVRRFIDNTVYSGGFDLPAVWLGKYGYYADRRKKQGLSSSEYKILVNYTDLLFDCWLNFYKTIESDPRSACIINETQKSPAIGHAVLNDEFEKYQQDKESYINDLLDKGFNHPFAQINDFVYDNAINGKFLKKEVYKRHRKFYKKLDRKEFWLNIKNNSFKIRRCLTNKTYLKNTILCLFSGLYSRKISVRPKWELVSSMQKKLDAVFDILEKRGQGDKPFYISLHTEEPHNNITYFSYDINNQKLIDEEFAYMEPLLDECGKDFKGNLLYLLSLRYVDLCLKRLIDKLKELNLLGNTTIALIADHGTSYFYDPVRDTVVNNFHNENYKTPLVVWNYNNKQLKAGTYKGLYSAEDVQKTICKAADLKTMPSQYKGYVVPELSHGRDFVITEYMGPGCPDMLSREVWMTGRNKKYCIAYKNHILEPFNEYTPVEIYDLEKDPKEMHNLAKKLSVKEEEILKLAKAVHNRFDEIKKETDEFVAQLGEWSVLI